MYIKTIITIRAPVGANNYYDYYYDYDYDCGNN